MLVGDGVSRGHPAGMILSVCESRADRAAIVVLLTAAPGVAPRSRVAPAQPFVPNSACHFDLKKSR